MLEQDPRITEGSTFFQSLYAWMKRAAVEVNAKAPINSPVLTGDPQAPTPANSDNDTSIATTAWVRNAMSNIATTAGFVFSAGSTGYIKFPSWMGGWIVQWGSVVSNVTPFNGVGVAYPLTFPNNWYVTQLTPYTSAGSIAEAHMYVPTTSGFGVLCNQPSTTIMWVAVGN